MNTQKTTAFLLKAFKQERMALTLHDLRCALLGGITLFILLVVADAAFAFHMQVLYFLKAGFWLTVSGFAGWVFVRRLQRQFHPETMALAVQKRIGVPHDRLINALQLAREEHPHASHSLREMAIELAENCSAELDPKKMIPRRRVKCSIYTLSAGLCLTGLLFWTEPGLITSGWRRLQDPGGDHPPFTRLHFELRTQPERLHAGSDMKIVVRVRGPKLPTSAQLRIKQPDGNTRLADFYTRPSQEKENGRVFELAMENLRESLEVAVDTPKGRSVWTTISLLPSPIFEQVRVRYIYPAYTGWPQKEQQMRHTDLSVIRGTRIVLTAVANLPLSRGEFSEIQPNGVQTPWTAFPAETTNPEKVAVAWEPADSGIYQLRLFSEDGTPGEVDWEGRITLKPDLPPEVELRNADLDGIVPEGWEVPVSALATDDVQVRDGRMVIQVNERPATAVPLLPAPDRALVGRMEIQQTLSLDDLGVMAGAGIQYFVEVRDNCPPEGQWASTRIARLQVVTLEEYRRYARTLYHSEEVMEEILAVRRELEQLRDDRNRLLEKLESLRAALPAGQAPTPEQIREMASVQQEMREYILRVGELDQWIGNRLEFESLYSFEEPYKKWLGELSEGLQGQVRDADALQRSWTPDPSVAPWNDDFDAAEIRFRENTSPYPPEILTQGEQLQQDLEMMEKLSQLIQQTQRLSELAADQEELAEKLRMQASMQNQDPDSSSRLRDLAAQQREMEKELSNIREKLDGLAGELSGPMPELASEAMQLGLAMDEQQIERDQLAAAGEAELGNSGGAAADAQRAADKLKALAGQAGATASACKAGGGACESLSTEQFNQSIQQLLDAMQIPPPGADGMPTSIPQGLGQGGVGAGMSGSMSMMGMVGPQYPSRGGNMSGFEMPGRSLGNGPGRAGGGTAEALEGPGTVNPEQTREENRATRQYSGVPERYRPLVEAYFQRLAEDRVKE